MADSADHFALRRLDAPPFGDAGKHARDQLIEMGDDVAGQVGLGVRVGRECQAGFCATAGHDDKSSPNRRQSPGGPR
jgi:hypothetical protein